MPSCPYQRRSVIEENENEIQLTSPVIHRVSSLLRFLAPRSPATSHNRAIASLADRWANSASLWSGPPSSMYIYCRTLGGHFRYLGRTSAFVICGEITASIKIGAKTIPPDGRRNLIRSDTPRAYQSFCTPIFRALRDYIRCRYHT